MWFFSDGNLVVSVESSAVSKSLITNKLRWFNVVGCSTRKVWFHKRLYHR
ncbi:general secretion pathway protein GspH [Vibrio metoecus]|nr:general secretion pathway protein GspH [Vibrio metoecus]